MQQILLATPSVNDSKNWEFHLSKKTKYPFEAVIQGEANNPPGIPLMVKGFAYFDEELGGMMKIKSGRDYLEYPLHDIKGTGKQKKIDHLLEDYHKWFEDCFEMDFMEDDDFFF